MRMGIIAWIILGLLAGGIAKAVMPGDDPGGVIVTMVIGIVRAIAGGLIGEWIGFGGLGTFFDPHLDHRRRRLAPAPGHRPDGHERGTPPRPPPPLRRLP
jgi:uncharacterized membrane protein YeaQ/YmgE (transglycosylase-associated protein family)